MENSIIQLSIYEIYGNRCLRILLSFIIQQIHFSAAGTNRNE